MYSDATKLWGANPLFQTLTLPKFFKIPTTGKDKIWLSQAGCKSYGSRLHLCSIAVTVCLSFQLLFCSLLSEPTPRGCQWRLQGFTNLVQALAYIIHKRFSQISIHSHLWGQSNLSELRIKKRTRTKACGQLRIQRLLRSWHSRGSHWYWYHNQQHTSGMQVVLVSLPPLARDWPPHPSQVTWMPLDQLSSPMFTHPEHLPLLHPPEFSWIYQCGHGPAQLWRIAQDITFDKQQHQAVDSVWNSVTEIKCNLNEVNRKVDSLLEQSTADHAPEFNDPFTPGNIATLNGSRPSLAPAPHQLPSSSIAPNQILTQNSLVPDEVGQISQHSNMLTLSVGQLLTLQTHQIQATSASLPMASSLTGISPDVVTTQPIGPSLSQHMLGNRFPSTHTDLCNPSQHPSQLMRTRSTGSLDLPPQGSIDSSTTTRQESLLCDKRHSTVALLRRDSTGVHSPPFPCPS